MITLAHTKRLHERVPLKPDEEDDSTSATKKTIIETQVGSWGTGYHRRGHVPSPTSVLVPDAMMSYRKSVDPHFSVHSRSRYTSPLNLYSP